MQRRATILLTTFGFWIIPRSTRVRNSPIKWGAKRAAEKYPNLATSGYKPRVLEKHKVFSFFSKGYHLWKWPHLPSMNKSMGVSRWKEFARTFWKDFLEHSQHLRPFITPNCFFWLQVSVSHLSSFTAPSALRKILTLRQWSQLTAISRVVEPSRLLHK